MNKEKKLGRGLSALLGDIAYKKESMKILNVENDIYSNSLKEGVCNLDVSQIVIGSCQPRKNFDYDKLINLSKSIKQSGIIQPIITRRHPKQKGKFEIIAGERRFRASIMAGLKTIPSIVREVTNSQAIEFAIIENMQREDISPIEEAVGYKKLINDLNYTQEKISQVVGYSRSYIANIIRLLLLPNEVIKMIDNKLISVGHGKALVKSKSPIELANKIIREGFSVRKVEEIVKLEQNKILSSNKKILAINNNNLQKLEQELSQKIGCFKVKIYQNSKNKKTKISITCNNLSEMEQLINSLKIN